MQVSTLKELEQLLKLCRRMGVETMTVNDMTFKLGDEPVKPVSASKKAQQMPEVNVPFQGLPNTIEAKNEKILNDTLSEEQLLFYSVTGEAT